MALKRHLRVLEKAFASEIARAMLAKRTGHIPLSIGNSKPVKECVELGYLEPAQAVFMGLTFKGHELTHLGRMTYGESCADAETEDAADGLESAYAGRATV